MKPWTKNSPRVKNSKNERCNFCFDVSWRRWRNQTSNKHTSLKARQVVAKQFWNKVWRKYQVSIKWVCFIVSARYPMAAEACSWMPYMYTWSGMAAMFFGCWINSEREFFGETRKKCTWNSSSKNYGTFHVSSSQIFKFQYSTRSTRLPPFPSFRFQ